MKVGRPKDNRREGYAKWFGVNLPKTRPDHKISGKLLDQLDLCRSDEARRLLLGVSHKEGVENHE